MRIVQRPDEPILLTAPEPLCLFQKARIIRTLRLYKIAVLNRLMERRQVIEVKVKKEFLSSGILGMFNMFAGGALERMTIFALNIMPYISASIILQLGQSVIPSLAALKKEGEAGHRKMVHYTKVLKED